MTRRQDRCAYLQGALFGDPPTNGTDTSGAAAEEKKATVAASRAAVYEVIARQSMTDGGATDEEIGAALGWDGNSVRPRRWELVKAGIVIDSGTRRPTASGGTAKVWMLDETGHVPRPAVDAAEAGPFDWI